jgi:hypothetical protein
MHSSDVQKCFNADFSEGKNIKALVEFQNNFHKNNRVFTFFFNKTDTKMEQIYWEKSEADFNSNPMI